MTGELASARLEGQRAAAALRDAEGAAEGAREGRLFAESRALDLEERWRTAVLATKERDIALETERDAHADTKVGFLWGTVVLVEFC